MERLNFQVIEKKWQKEFSKQKLYREKGKNFIVLKCFLIHPGKSTWVM